MNPANLSCPYPRQSCRRIPNPLVRRLMFMSPAEPERLEGKQRVCVPYAQALLRMFLPRVLSRINASSLYCDGPYSSSRFHARYTAAMPDQGEPRMVQPFQNPPRRVKPSAYATLFGSGDLSRIARCAIVVAHPGDDIAGAGCLISKLDNVNILYVTDGADLDAESTETDRAAYANRRITECLSALTLAGVSSDRVVSLGLRLNDAALHLPELAHTIAAFLQSSGADIIITHPYEGGHPDHDATAFATHAALRLINDNGFRPPAVFEMALRPTEDGSAKVPDFLPAYDWEITTLSLNQSALEQKQRMIDCLQMQRECLKASPPGPERFRRTRRYDFTLPPEPGSLHYEKFCHSFSGCDWQTLAQRALADLFPDAH